MNQKQPTPFACVVFLFLLAFLLGQSGAVRADSPIPRAPEIPVQPPPAPQQSNPEILTAGSRLTLATQLKAVVFVGPIDGETGNWTLSEIASAQQTAAALRSYGVNVQEFYPNQANGTWANIKAAANGAHFLIYRGHGVYWSAMPTPDVGGFALKDTFVSNDMIRSELRPAKNFIVMLYGCFTAGSSGNDSASISLAEARRRVAMYSDPFFDIGAGGYYADWYGEAFTSYASSLLQGKTQRAAYESFYDYNSSLMWRGTHPDHPELSLWLGWDNWNPPLPNYNNAFAGDPDATLVDLFDTRMVLSQTSVSYLAEPDFPQQEYQVTVSSTSSTTFDWIVSAASLPAWLALKGPAQGVAGESFAFIIDPAKADGVGNAVFQVSTNASNVGDPSQRITVSLVVVNTVQSMYLPVVIK